MIEQTFESKRKQVYQPAEPIDNTAIMPWFSEREKYQAKMRGITPAEYIRREQVVKDLFTACPYSANDTVYPSDPKEFKRYGAVRVLGICASYMMIDKDETWPKNDNPLIVTFQPLSNPKNTMFCTVNFLDKKMPMPEEVTC
jgi:hypothetical protein